MRKLILTRRWRVLRWRRSDTRDRNVRRVHGRLCRRKFTTRLWTSWWNAPRKLPWGRARIPGLIWAQWKAAWRGRGFLAISTWGRKGGKGCGGGGVWLEMDILSNRQLLRTCHRRRALRRKKYSGRYWR